MLRAPFSNFKDLFRIDTPVGQSVNSRDLYTIVGPWLIEINDHSPILTARFKLLYVVFIVLSGYGHSSSSPPPPPVTGGYKDPGYRPGVLRSEG